MTIQTSIIEALKASQFAHQAGLAEVQTLRAEKLSLQEKVAALETQVAALRAESVKIVDPDTVQPLLEELARAVAATHAAITPAKPQPAPPAPPVAAPAPAEPAPKPAPGAPVDPAEFAKSVASTQAPAAPVVGQ